MNENAPPPGTNAAAGTGDASRGMPYYEKLRRDLRETLQKKRALDQNLVGTISNIIVTPSPYHKLGNSITNKSVTVKLQLILVTIAQSKTNTHKRPNLKRPSTKRRLRISKRRPLAT